MKKIIAPILALIIAIMAIPATPVHAVSPPPPNMWYGTLTVEYRYAQGQKPNVPQTIQRFGYTYNLVSQSKPVLEKELPLVRTYTYDVWGYLTQEQIDEIKGMTDVVILEERTIDIGQQADREDTVTGLPANDVDDLIRIPMTKVFDVGVYDADGNPVMQGGSQMTVKSEMNRVGVTFTEAYDPADIDGPPIGYDATVVYRGIGLVRQGTYYRIGDHYTTNKESDVPIYVIVAEYQTDEMPPPADFYIGGGAGAGAGAGGEETTIAGEEVPLASPAAITPPVDSNGAPVTIGDGVTPLADSGSDSVTTFFTPLLLIVIMAMIVALTSFIVVTVKRKRTGDQEAM